MDNNHTDFIDAGTSTELPVIGFYLFLNKDVKHHVAMTIFTTKNVQCVLANDISFSLKIMTKLIFKKYILNKENEKHKIKVFNHEFQQIKNACSLWTKIIVIDKDIH